MHAQTNKKLLLRKKSSDPLNLPMTPKFSSKGSSMTPKNYGLAETLLFKKKEVIFSKKCRQPKKHAKLPSMQRVRD